MYNKSVTVISEIVSGIRAIEEDKVLYKEVHFDSRANALDFIDFHILDRIEGLPEHGETSSELHLLKQQAKNIKHKLEKIDANLFEQLRKKIRKSFYRGSSFREMVCKYVREDGNGINYDNLDVFINGLLSEQVIPEPILELEAEMVFYQKTPARIIFQLAELAQLRPDDVFFDIGSGLGQAAILVNLLSGAIVKGIEYEPAYCDYAKACAANLGLANVEFINADARKGDYSQGTVFFLYTPFEGSMLQNMLDILQKETQKNAIRIFTYGPCSSYVGRQSWLNIVNGEAGGPYKLHEFKSPDTG